MYNFNPKIFDELFNQPSEEQRDLFFNDPKNFTGFYKPIKIKAFPTGIGNKNLKLLRNLHPDDVFISTQKPINLEYRVVVIKEAIDACIYARKQKLFLKANFSEKTEVLNYINSVHQKYKPAECYIVDVVDVENGFKILEYNPLTCSDLYLLNIDKIIQAFSKSELIRHF